MTPPPGRARRAGALLVAVLALLLAAVPGAALADEHEMSVEVSITRVTPQVLRPGDDVALSVTVRNTGSTPVAEPRVTLSLDRDSFISRTSLDRWRGADGDDPVGTALVDLDLEEPLAPGASQQVRLDLPAASVGLRSAWSSWGPRGTAVTVVDRADPARQRLGVARTFLLWFPPDEVTATRVSVLVPFVGPAVDPYDEQWVEELEDLVGGRLGDALAATGDASHVSWLVDPWLVEVGTAPDAAQEPPDGTTTSSPSAGPTATDDPAPDQDDGAQGGEGTDGEGTDGEAQTASPAPDDPGAAEPTIGTVTVRDRSGPLAREWVQELLSATVDRDVHVLPYGDADVEALVHADRPQVLATAVERSAQVVASDELPDGAVDDLLLPVRDLPDLEVAAFAASTGRSVVVGPGELLPQRALTYTPSGRASADTSAGDATVLVPDERLSAALLDGHVLTEDGRADDPTVLTPATAAQDLLAELAVITRERPSDGRHVLAALPRDWHPDPDVAAAQLAALARTPWVRTEPISALVGTPDPGIDRGRLPERTASATEVPAAEVDAMAEALADRRALAALVPEPRRLLGDPERELLALTSVAWRADPTGRADVLDGARSLTDTLRGAVSVPVGSTVNLLSRTGELSVRIVNALDQPVTLDVALRPRDWHLRVDRTVEVTVPAGGEETVRIPVHAVQTADVPVAVELRTTDGVLVDDRTVMTVRVRAEWEGIATVVIGAALALLVVIGLIRTIRRGRTGSRAEPVVAGPDALSPESVHDPAPAPEVPDDRG